MAVSLDAGGRVRFSVGGLELVSTAALVAGCAQLVSACREPSGALKIYIDGALDSCCAGGVDPQRVVDAAPQLGGFDGSIGAFSLQDSALDCDGQAYLYNDALKEACVLM